jgi:hypothetical protein
MPAQIRAACGGTRASRVSGGGLSRVGSSGPMQDEDQVCGVGSQQNHAGEAAEAAKTAVASAERCLCRAAGMRAGPGWLARA